MLSYHDQNIPIDTIEDLNTLLERIGQEASSNDAVDLYLPPVTYSEPLVLSQRSVNLYGCTDGQERTVFAQGIQARYGSGGITYLYDLDFVGTGSEVGVSAASRVWAIGCTFTGLKTGVLLYGESWGNLTQCQLADNQSGLHFNSTGQSVSSRSFPDNRFQDNTPPFCWKTSPRMSPCLRHRVYRQRHRSRQPLQPGPGPLRGYL